MKLTDAGHQLQPADFAEGCAELVCASARIQIVVLFVTDAQGIPWDRGWGLASTDLPVLCCGGVQATTCSELCGLSSRIGHCTAMHAHHTHISGITLTPTSTRRHERLRPQQHAASAAHALCPDCTQLVQHMSFICFIACALLHRMCFVCSVACAVLHLHAPYTCWQTCTFNLLSYKCWGVVAGWPRPCPHLPCPQHVARWQTRLADTQACWQTRRHAGRHATCHAPQSEACNAKPCSPAQGGQ